MKINQYLLVGSMFLFMACETEVDLDVPGEESKLVINGVVREDSVLRVSVSKSRFILDIEPLTVVEDASLQLSVGGNAMGNWEYLGYGVYEAQGIVPEAGQLFELQVSAPGLASINAQTVVPDPMNGVALVSVEKNQEDPIVRVRLRITDPAQTADYYVINRVSYETVHDGQGNQQQEYRLSHLNSDATNVISTCQDEFGSDYTGCKVLFSDRAFEGGQKELVVKFNTYSWDPTIEGEHYIVVSRVSKAYYDYLLSLHQNFQAGDNPFAEPFPISMNITGGYGIWGGAASRWLPVR